MTELTVETEIILLKRENAELRSRVTDLEDLIYGEARDGKSGLIVEFRNMAMENKFYRWIYALIVAVIMPILTLVTQKVLPGIMGDK